MPRGKRGGAGETWCMWVEGLGSLKLGHWFESPTANASILLRLWLLFTFS